MRFPPPILPCFFQQKEKWEKILKKDEEMCLSFISRIQVPKSRRRPTKRKRFDDIQNFLDVNNQIEKNNIKITNNQPFSIYWDSPEAKKLYHPFNLSETVIDCLLRREDVLISATTNDKHLLHLLKDTTDISDISIIGREKIRYQCMYLRKAYEIALQRMNFVT